MQSGPILLTGVRGQVGGELLPLLRQFGEVTAPTREELDLADAEAVRRYVRELSPRLIVNPAAYTAVDKAESEPELARALNTVAPEILGKEAARLGIAVLHFSTDYVFAGEGTEPWTEDSLTGPLGVYGATKLAGEQALAASGAVHLIFRTSWVYGTRGKNFLFTVLRLAAEREQIRIVADQHGAPTWSRDLAHLVEHVVRAGLGSSAASGASRGARSARRRVPRRGGRGDHLVWLCRRDCAPRSTGEAPRAPGSGRSHSDSGVSHPRAPSCQLTNDGRQAARPARVRDAGLAGLGGKGDGDGIPGLNAIGLPTGYEPVPELQTACLPCSLHRAKGPEPSAPVSQPVPRLPARKLMQLRPRQQERSHPVHVA